MDEFERTFPLCIAIRWPNSGAATVMVTGDLDNETVPALRRALDEIAATQPATIMVDLSAVAFFSCAAVTELLAARGRYPCALRVVNPAPAVTLILNILGLDTDLTRGT